MRNGEFVIRNSAFRISHSRGRLDKIKSAISGFFGGVVEPLVRLTPFGPAFLPFREYRKWVRRLAPQAHGKLLDVGSGEQPWRRYLEPCCDSYIALDFPLGQELSGPASGVRPDVWGRALKLPFRGCSFDTVVCFHVLEHLSQPWTAFEEFRRVLRPGGTLILATPFLYHGHGEPLDYFRFTQFAYESLAKSVGFEPPVVHACGSPPGTIVNLLNHSLLKHCFRRLPLGMFIQLAFAPVAFVMIFALNLLGFVGGLLFRHSSYATFHIGVMRLNADCGVRNAEL